MKIKSILIAALIATALYVVSFGGDFPPKAHAAGTSAGFPDNVNVSCTTSPTLIQSKRGQTAVTCQCDSAVSWGDASVTTADYSSVEVPAEFREVYCISGGSVACRCLTNSRSRS